MRALGFAIKKEDVKEIMRDYDQVGHGMTRATLFIDVPATR